MSLFVQVIEGQVVKVWDTPPPEGEADWHSAIEVKPAITANRQTYDGHTFDVSVDPVQIVYAVKDITVDDRKGSLISVRLKAILPAGSQRADANLKQMMQQLTLTSPLPLVHSQRL
jgi:hypothetical protein